MAAHFGRYKSVANDNSSYMNIAKSTENMFYNLFMNFLGRINISDIINILSAENYLTLLRVFPMPILNCITEDIHFASNNL